MGAKICRKIIYGKCKREVGSILRKLRDYKKVEIVEVHACVEQILICHEISPKYSVSDFRTIFKFEVQLWESAVLVQRIFCEHGGN
jgi:putative transposase